MQAVSAPQKLSPLQLELLKVYSFQPSEEDLLSIKQMLGQFFAEKLSRQVEKAITEKGISNDDLDRWLHEKA